MTDEQKPKVTLRQTKNNRYILRDEVKGYAMYFTSGDAALQAKLELERKYAEEENG
jgi:hypothetical protein